MKYLIEYGADFLILLPLIIKTIKGARRGFAKSIISLLIVLASLACASVLAAPAAELAYEKAVGGMITKKVEQAMPDGFNGDTAKEIVRQTADMLPPFIEEQLGKSFDISINEIADNVSREELSKETTAEKITETVIRPFALSMLKVITYVIIFILCRAVLDHFIRPLKEKKLPVLKSADKLLGGIMGLIGGAALSLIVCMLLKGVGSMLTQGPVNEAIDSSRLIELLGGIDLSAIIKRG